MNKSIIMIGAVAMLLLSSCRFSSKTKERVTNINVELQDSVETILQRHLTEYDAMDGVAIVMETQSGRIRTMVGLASEDDSIFVRADSLVGVGRCSALMRTVSMLAALNTGKVNPDTRVNVGEGVYLCGKDTIFDHNWRRGGYGDMTLSQAFVFSSNIGTVKAVDAAFKDKKQFAESVKKMSFGEPCEVDGIRIDSSSQEASTLPWYFYALGNKETSPIQMLTFYNAIANSGKMVAPLLFEPLSPIDDGPQVLNPQIASPASIATIQKMLKENITKGLGKQALSDKLTMSGMNGTICNKDGSLTADFCGYFSTKNTGYTVVVSVYRKENPASGGYMAGTIFKEIAELMNRHKDTY